MKRKKVTEGADSIIEGVKRYKEFFVKSRDRGKIKAGLDIALHFMLSLFLSMVKAPMGVYPFAYATIFASSGGIHTVASFTGAVLSTVTMDAGGLWQILILVSLTAIRTGICFLKGDFKEKNGLFRRLFRERGYLRVICASLGAAAFGCITIIESESIYFGIFSALFAIASTAIATCAFIFLSDKGAESYKRCAGLAVLFVGITASLDAFGLPFSLGASFAFFAAIYFSYTKNTALGCVVGVACGLAVGGEYGAAFASVAIISALLWEYSSVAAVVLSALCASAIALFTRGFDAVGEIIPEIAFSAAITLPLISAGILPPTLWSGFDVNVPIKPARETDPNEINERYARIGESLEGLSKMLCEVSTKMCLPSKSEANQICTSARAKYCSSCTNERICSGREEAVVTSLFNNMAYRLSTSGKVSAKIVPDSLARRCYNMDSILEAVNSSCKRMWGLSSSYKKTEMFASDYSAIATLLKDISAKDDYERDTQSELLLTRKLSEEGFTFSSLSLYGKRERHIYMRGIDLASSKAGERDITHCAATVLGGKLSSPEFSIDGKEISAEIHSEPLIKLRSARYALRSERDLASGDSTCSFENNEGYFYTLVSDGMGSGREAALTSGISASFLEKLLSAGCPMRSALELLNCFIRGARGECFTTVDLMEADTFTKRARFIKSGAAPSFILRDGQIYRIHSKTVPVGIMRALDAESVAFDLEGGDTVVMISDGVTGSYEECPWLYEVLCDDKMKDEDAQKIAKYIAEQAAINTGKDDDITVCVIKVTST